MTVYTREQLEAERMSLPATIGTLIGVNQWPEVRRLTRRLSDIERLLVPPRPSPTTLVQCEWTIPISRSRSLRRSAEAGYRQCKQTATWRFFGWLGGKPKDEYACARHARVYLDPVAWPGWIDGAIRLRYRMCRKGHTIVAHEVQRALDQNDWLLRGDVLKTTIYGCALCGELVEKPQGETT